MNDRDALVGAVVLAALAGAMFTGRSEPIWTVLGAGLVGAGAAAVALDRWQARLAAVALAAVGGWIMADMALRIEGAPAWMRAVGVVTATAVAVTVGTVARVGLSPPVVYAAVIVTAGGIWACVPETDGAGRGLAVVASAAVAAMAWRRPVAPALAGAVLGLMVFAGISGGQYRPSAVIGMAGSFGILLVLGPVAMIVPGAARTRGASTRGPGSASSWWPERSHLVLLGAHVVAAVLASRVAGRGGGLARSVLVEAVVLAALVAVVVVVTRTNKERAS